MFFDEPTGSFEPMPRQLSTVLVIATVVNLFFVVWPSLVTGPAAAAAKALF